MISSSGENSKYCSLEFSEVEFEYQLELGLIPSIDYFDSKESQLSKNFEDNSNVFEKKMPKFWFITTKEKFHPDSYNFCDLFEPKTSDRRRVHNKAAAKRHRQKKSENLNQLIRENIYLKSELELSQIEISAVYKLVELLCALVAPQANMIIKLLSIQDLIGLNDLEVYLSKCIPLSDCKNEVHRANQINFLISLIRLIKQKSI